MRYRFVAFLLVAVAGGCTLFEDNHRDFSIFFQPYSSDMDDAARETVHAAAAFARRHPLQPVSIIGFSAPPDPGKDVDGLSVRRAEEVMASLIQDGVGASRITVKAAGITDPQGMPKLAVRRVDIEVGK